MSIKHTKDLVQAEELLKETVSALKVIANQQYAKGSQKDTQTLANKIDKFLNNNKHVRTI